MPFTTLTNNKVLDAFHGKVTYTAPTNIYAALSTTTPTVGGTNFTEPSGNGYARVAVPAASWASASASSSANTAVITFPTASGAGWGTATYIGFYDALTAGNLISFDDLPAAQSIPSGVTPSIAVGAAIDSMS